MSGRFSVCRISNWRSICTGFCGLVLGWSVATQTAIAQDKASILERAEEVSNFLELLEHENSIVRQMSIADGLASDNRYIRDAAIEAGFNSDDVKVRKEAMAGVLSTKPVFFIEVPIELDAKMQAHDSTKWWSNARLELTSEFFDPDDFKIMAKSGTSDNLQCVLRGDETVCRSVHYASRLTLSPGVNGTLIGAVENKDWRMPIVIRNY